MTGPALGATIVFAVSVGDGVKTCAPSRGVVAVGVDGTVPFDGDRTVAASETAELDPDEVVAVTLTRIDVPAHADVSGSDTERPPGMAANDGEAKALRWAAISAPVSARGYTATSDRRP